MTTNINSLTQAVQNIGHHENKRAKDKTNEE